MPMYHHFYVERRYGTDWRVPKNYSPEDVWTFECDHFAGHFLYVHPRVSWLDLFFSDHALFPFKSGPPPERGTSPLLQELELWDYNFVVNEDRLAWIPYEDLLIEEWEHETIYRHALVPANFSHLFELGTSPFPGLALLKLGASPRELQVMRNGSWAVKPIDKRFGAERLTYDELKSNKLVLVTWRQTVTEFIGADYVRRFRSVLSYGNERNLRILTTQG